MIISVLQIKVTEVERSSDQSYDMNRGARIYTPGNVTA